MDDRVKTVLAGLDLWMEWPLETQRRIVNAAVASFSERGFHGTSLKHIANGSGLSTAALYLHFSSKEDVLFALSRRGHALTLDLVRNATTDTDPGLAMDVLVQVFTGWHAEHRMMARVAQYELGALSVEHREEVDELRRETERVVRELIERGVAAGVFAVPDVRAAAAAVLSLGIDVSRWYTPGGLWAPGELGTLYAGFVRKFLCTASPADAGPPPRPS